MATEKDTKSLDPFMDTRLRAARRAADGASVCAEILQQHMINEASVPATPGVWIRLEPNQVFGLVSAIEAAARQAEVAASEVCDHYGLSWLDEQCPKVSREAELSARLSAGEIDFDEYQRQYYVQQAPSQNGAKPS